MKTRPRTGLALTLLFTAAAFAGLAAGPERVNPYLAAVLGLQAPRSTPPASVPEASATSVRVLDTVSDAGVRAHVARFTEHRSRVPGYPGHAAAAEYIRRSFENAGLQDVRAETVRRHLARRPGRQPDALAGRCHVSHPRDLAEPRQDLHVAAGRVRTRLIYGAAGKFADFNGHALEGAAVLMEFNTRNNWLNAATLGAEQIIFIEPDSTFYTEAEQKFLQVPNGIEAILDRQSVGAGSKDAD